MTKFILSLALLLPTVPLSAAPESSASPARYSPELGGNRQLFIDDYRIESLRNVERVLHPCTKLTTPVMTADRPWEKDAVYLYGTVLYDEDEKLFKMWYQTFYKTPPEAYVLYATSTDGVNWQKPELGVYEWRGSKENNIVLRGEIGTVVKDSRASDPQRCYKMLVFQRPGYHAYFSPDGLRWTKAEKSPVIPDGDVSNVTWDPYRKRFVAMTKNPHKAGRVAFFSTSADFVEWTTPTLALAADERDQAAAEARGAQRTEIYGMPAVPYEGVYLGFPWMFHITGEGAKDTAGDEADSSDDGGASRQC